MARWFRVLNALRVGALVVASIATVAGASGAAAAEQVYGGSFESKAYGFSFEWDEGLWNATPVEIPNAEGLDTESVSSAGTIYASPSESESGDCYADIMSTAEYGGDDWRVAPDSVKRPNVGGDVQGELFQVTFSNGEQDSVLLLYMGCRPLDDGAATLNVVLATERSGYLKESKNWQKLLGSIEVNERGGDGTRTSNMPEIGIGAARENGASTAGRATGIDGGTYTQVTYGFALSWDESTWTSRELTPDVEVGDGIYLESDLSVALITSRGYPSGDATSCLDDYAEAFAADSGVFEEPRTAPARYDRPVLADDAAGNLYVASVKNKGTDIALYLECRVIPETDSIVIFHFVTGVSNYDDELASWQDVLDSVDPLPQPRGVAQSAARVVARF